MDLEHKSIERIKLASQMSLHSYKKPLLCCYSGGKDSDVMLELFLRSGVPFEVQSSHTTVDAPETVYHIREKFKELEEKGIKCTIDYPKYKGKRITMWSLIPMKKLPPTRIVRYCCQILKESAGDGRMVATGVRWDESNNRAMRGGLEVIGKTKKDKIILTNDNNVKRSFIEKCEMRAKTVCNPIIEWKHSDIWEYINSERIKTNPLYQCGYNRVGCIGCPVAGRHRYKEFADYPTYEKAYKKAFEKMLKEIKKSGRECKWKNGDEVFDWWMEDINIPGQMTLDDFITN